jgi:HAD superfamily hydrolase (TIGR01509 family)
MLREAQHDVYLFKGESMSAILFGSIGALADTSELQRESFNTAFAQHGLDWNWSRDEYRTLLSQSGGAQRIADYAKDHGDSVDAAAVHATKSEIFQERLRTDGVAPRAGVTTTIAEALHDGIQVALVTTTSPDNVKALGEALRPSVDLEQFALVVDTTSVENAKPAPDAYAYALQKLGEPADACVAVEDNVGGVAAAHAAGVTVVAFPGENNAGHRFDGAAQEVEELDFSQLRDLVHAA